MKVLLFSHESDIDGMGSVVLSKLAFSDFDYVLASTPKGLELKFRDYINDKVLYNYDNIYITDLSLENPSLDMVANDDVLKNKVKVFDHHDGAIKNGLNKYDFTFIEEVDKNGIKRCGTEIFYKYLLDNNYLKRTESLDKFVEFTRLEDTWEWKKNNKPEAHDLSILFSNIGIINYIESMYSKLKDNNFFFSKEEKELLDKIKEENINNIKKYISEAEFFIDENNNLFGITIAPYEFRNDLPEYIRDHNDKNVKYFITVAFDKEKYGQKSYRSIDKSIDVNEIAMKHNGAGNPFAAGVSITEEQNKKMKTMPKKLALEYISKCSYENI